MSRIVAQFSNGVASAVAAKLAKAQYGQIEIVNAYLLEEHEVEPLSEEQVMELAGEPDTSNAFEEDQDRREMTLFATAIQRAAAAQWGLRLKEAE